MVHLILNRPQESVNKSHSYSIFVNDEHVADLSNNSEQTFRIDTDTVDIQARMGWSGSQKITLDAKNKDTLKVKVRGNKFYNRVIRYTGGAIFPSLAAAWIITPDSPALNYGLLAVGILILLLFIYTLTVDRNSWIIISEVES